MNKSKVDYWLGWVSLAICISYLIVFVRTAWNQFFDIWNIILVLLALFLSLYLIIKNKGTKE